MEIMTDRSYKYDEETAAWWLAKSRTTAHQRAYDAIAAMVKLSGRNVAIDYACGSGELIKRLYLNFNRRDGKAKELPLIIGVDKSSEMLRAAAENLIASGIQPVLVKDPTEVMQYRGVVLVNDDFTASQLPAEISDTTFLTFPEIEIDLKNPRAKAIFDEFVSPERLEFVTSVQHYWLARATKKGRNIIVVDYTVSDEKGIADKRQFEFERGVAMRRGLQLVRRTFTPDSDVFSDIHDGRKSQYETFGMRKGYVTLLFRKL